MAIRQQGDELGAEYPHIINQPRMPGYQQPSSPVIIITVMMAVEPDKRRKKQKKKKKRHCESKVYEILKGAWSEGSRMTGGNVNPQ